MTLKAIDNSITLEAYDGQTGVHLPNQRQVIWNSPIGEYMPGIDAIIVQSSRDESNLSDKLVEPDQVGLTEEKAEELIKTGKVTGELTAHGPVVEATSALIYKFQQPITRKLEVLDSKGDVVEIKELPGQYHRDYAWGSGIKDGKTIGIKTDIFAEKGILHFEEDTYRMQRAYFPNATAGVRGKLRVKLVDVGTIIPGIGKVDDGWGYIRKSITDMTTPKFRKIQQGAWNSSFSFLQRYELTDELFAELKPHIDAGLKMVSASNEDFVRLVNAKGCDTGSKNYFAELDSTMPEHPFIADALASTRAKQMFRVATAGNLAMQGGVFAPTTSDNLVLPRERFEASNEYIITRYPIDGPGSIRAIKAEQFGDEAERIAKMECVQYTLTDWFNCSFKGMLGIVDNEEAFGDYDMIVCVEDEKLNSAWTTPDEVDKSEKEYTFNDAVLSFTMWYTAGSCIGVPHDLAKDLNADYDGDQGAVIPGCEFPELLRQTHELKQLRNPKLPKSKTPFTPGESRATRALLSMANIVGHATNTVSTVLNVKDQEWMAIQLGYENADEMHEFFMYAIKIGTDIFKTTADYRPVVAQLSRITSNLNNFKISAPWTRWRDDSQAFRHQIPPVAPPTGLPNPTEWEKRNFVTAQENADYRQDAIIAALLRYALPQMELPPQVVIRPLSHYKDWATMPANESYYKWSKALLNRYAERVQTVNLSSTKDWATFVSQWQAAIHSVAKTNSLDITELANSMFSLSHSDQRANETGKMASAVFVGLPEETAQIITEKPGIARLNSQVRVAVNGLKYQLPTAHNGLKVNVRLVPFIEEKGGKQLRRMALVANEQLPGQVQPKAHHYPRNTLGVVAVQDIAHQEQYTATLAFQPGKRNGGSWYANMVAV